MTVAVSMMSLGAMVDVNDLVPMVLVGRVVTVVSGVRR